MFDNMYIPVFIIFKGYLTGGKDGIVCLWDEAFENCIKTYKIEQEAICDGSRLFKDYPAIRALALGQDSILAGTKNSEASYYNSATLYCLLVCIGDLCAIFVIFIDSGNSEKW